MEVVLRLIWELKNCPLHFRQGQHHTLLNLPNTSIGSISFPNFTSLLRQPTQVATVNQEGGREVERKGKGEGEKEKEKH